MRGETRDEGILLGHSVACLHGDVYHSHLPMAVLDCD